LTNVHTDGLPLPEAGAPTDMMMTYGMFVFGLDTAAYQELQRQTAWRHAAQNRVGRRAARQFLGPGDDTITLTGVLLPQFTGGQQSLDELREMADEGAAWPLIEGNGTNYGLFVIESMSERKSHQTKDGAAQRIAFDLVLQRVEDDEVQRLGMLNPGDAANFGSVA
jgi:phage protein U